MAMNDIESNLSQRPSEDIILKEEDLTFKVFSKLHSREDGQASEFYFVLQDGMPIKLGDGTYSVVFEVMGANNQRHAVKILYEGLGELAERRFRKEAKLISTIRQVVGDVSSIIQPVGYTDRFDESQAFNKLTRSSSFARLGLKLSKYALVTYCYEGTLKDLLEKPAPLAGEEEVIPEYRDKSGYEVLASLNFEYRINTILPFLRSIAQGLAEIHKAGYYHLDLKPDNIYYKRTVNEFDVIIGDLGFIGQPEISGAAMTKEEVAFGTRHYRSPEQKDFFDICEVEVLPASPDDKKNREFQLVVRDPKFQDTIIEKGDNLMFSKDVHVKKDRQIMYHHEILEIKWLADNHAIIKIHSNHEIAPDKCTQVVMYKQQATRTDLFGFGAIFFDMLTCGRSPERFYGYLSNEDRSDKWVKDIREQYLRVASYSGEDPKFKGVFEAFLDRKTQDYAPLEVVELILKSMLYRAKGTFYNETGINKNLQRWWSANAEPVLAAIKSLNDLQKQNYVGILVNRDNPLIGGLRWKTQREDRGDLQKDIDNLQKLPISDLKRRVGHAAVRFNQLIELVDVSLKNSNFFFAELNPVNLRIREKIGFIYPKYEKLADYIDDLRADTVYTKVLFDAMDPYSPEEAIGYMRRKIELNLMEPHKEDATGLWKYRFLDTSPLGDEVSAQDWVLLPENKLTEVVRREEDLLELRKTPVGSPPDANWNIADLKALKMPIKGIYYRNLEPFKYYMLVLGTYLFQLFFVGLQSNGRSEPLCLRSLRAQIKSSPSLQANLRKLVASALSKPAFKKGMNEAQLMSLLYRRLTALYFALQLNELKLGKSVMGSLDTFSTSNQEQEGFKAIFKWYDVLQDIAKCLNLSPGHLMSSAYLSEIEKFGTFKLTEKSYKKLEDDDLPEELLIKLRSLENQSHTDKNYFVKAIEKAIGSEQIVEYESTILKSAKSDFEELGRVPQLNVIQHTRSILNNKIDMKFIIYNKADIIGSYREAINWIVQKLKR
jgi:serine/threonine protein kinase